MDVYRCLSCGKELTVKEGDVQAECEYCKTVQAVHPAEICEDASSDKKLDMVVSEQKNEILVNDNMDFSAKKRGLKRFLRKIFLFLVSVGLLSVFFINILVPGIKLYTAKELKADNYYDAAIYLLDDLGYSFLEDEIRECWYYLAKNMRHEYKYKKAAEIFKNLGYYKDSEKQFYECIYFAGLEEKEDENYYKAAEFFEAAEGYSCAEYHFVECCYMLAEEALADEDIEEAAMLFGKAGNFKDAKSRSYALWNEIITRDCADSNYIRTVAVCNNGRVSFTDYYGFDAELYPSHGLEEWENIIDISADGYDVVGLKNDGTVIAQDSVYSSAAEILLWNDIVDVACGFSHVVGLKSDGTVVALGNNFDGECDVSDWTDIIAVSAGMHQTVGLKSDGTVVATGENNGGQCEVSDWTDIVAVSVGDNHTVGIKRDGTVVITEYTGEIFDCMCDVSDWTDIVDVSVGYKYVAGLKSDGTVVIAGDYDNENNISEWTDINAVCAGTDFIIGVKKDGTMEADIYRCDFYGGEGDVDGWTDIRLSQ